MRGWAAVALAAVLLVPVLADAQGRSASRASPQGLLHGKAHQIAGDLQNLLSSLANLKGPGNVPWARTTGKTTLVQVVIVADNHSDKNLVALRLAIIRAGGSVHRRFGSMGTLSALLPASAIPAIAARADVLTITPNRPVIRTASLLDTQVGASDVRTTIGSVSNLDGTGVAIAFIDSGIMSSHKAFLDSTGKSRIVARTDVTQTSLDWTTGVDTSGLLGGNGGGAMDDPYGHGTLVASIAAGADIPAGPDSTGVAPGASIVDVRVLGSDGSGDLATTLAGFDWVMQNAQQYNIRVLNVSLGSDSTDSYINDPLCQAVRTAVAAGITVVVAAGNYGLASDGVSLIYGTISSPGDEPSAITVGSVNAHDTAPRGDDTINFFSSKGPTRGTSVDANNVTQFDNLLKPDLVAPGNKVLGALSTSVNGNTLSTLGANNPFSIVQRNPTGAGLIQGSGTSFAAPVVSGTVALLLQANPGLTPPMIKAILQYTAQPLTNANVVQQGAGEVDLPGAVSLATAITPSLASGIAAGTFNVGDSILAAGAAMPAPWSIVNGVRVDWSQFAIIGGSHVLTGDALFSSYQAMYDPELLWVNDTVWVTSPNLAPNGSVTGYTTGTIASGALMSDGITLLDGAMATNGIFTLSSDLTAQAVSGTGNPLSGGVVLANNMVMAEGNVMAENTVMAEGNVMAEAAVMAEGNIMAEGVSFALQASMAENVLYALSTLYTFAGEP